MQTCRPLDKALQNGAIALVDHAWLVNYYFASVINSSLPSEQQTTRPLLPCRQDLPPEAFVSIETLQLNTCPHHCPTLLPIIALSYAWL